MMFFLIYIYIYFSPTKILNFQNKMNLKVNIYPNHIILLIANNEFSILTKISLWKTITLSNPISKYKLFIFKQITILSKRKYLSLKFCIYNIIFSKNKSHKKI